MSVINILSPHVADLIAAGEVVERPASVVKELLENAIDAGARFVTVEIRAGGMRLIRVTDDGCGMTPEDAGVAFLRHATSKLRDEYGLESIATLGFRGEALAAISAVSRIELTTRARGAAEGTRVLLSAGDIDEMGPVGCPEGTTMAVRDLFYNTPARQKFMKSDRAEASACVNAALRVALGHPEMSVRFLKDGEEEFFSPGDGQMKSAVYSLLGRDNAVSLLECSGENEGVAVTGYVSAPHAGRGNRAMQFFFVNGRSFRSATLQAALEQAYKNTILTGRFPACVLYITLGFGKVDVNVHPTKSEVKFSEEKKVYDAVYYAVLSALQEKTERRTAEIRLSPTTEKAAQPKPDFYRHMSAAEYRGSGLAEKAASAGRGFAPGINPAPPVGRGLAPGRTPAPVLRDSGTAQYAASPLVPRPVIPREPASAVEKAPPVGRDVLVDNSSSVGRDALIAAEASPLWREGGGFCHTPAFRVIGEALDTYILVETEDSLLLIDKHAAHERMNFDRLLTGLDAPMSQTLLVPVTWSPGAETVELLEENMSLLESAGFELERFGDDGVVIRAVPSDCGGSEIALLEEFAEGLRTGKASDPREVLCHTIACKAAIKAGSRSDPKELAVLAEKVVSGEVRYCPHGRPVSVKLTKAELDKQFKRIV